MLQIAGDDDLGTALTAAAARADPLYPEGSLSPSMRDSYSGTRWLWGAFEQLRAAWAATVPADPVQQIRVHLAATRRRPLPRPGRVAPDLGRDVRDSTVGLGRRRGDESSHITS